MPSARSQGPYLVSQHWRLGAGVDILSMLILNKDSGATLPTCRQDSPTTNSDRLALPDSHTGVDSGSV
jgi:hypothetical protein